MKLTAPFDNSYGRRCPDGFFNDANHADPVWPDPKLLAFKPPLAKHAGDHHGSSDRSLAFIFGGNEVAREVGRPLAQRLARASQFGKL